MNLRQMDRSANVTAETTTLAISQVSDVDFMPGLAVSFTGNMGADLDDGLDDGNDTDHGNPDALVSDLETEQGAATELLVGDNFLSLASDLDLRHSVV